MPTRLAFARTHATPADRASVAVLVALLAVALVTFRDYGLAWDDHSHGQYGELLLAYYTSGFTDQRAFSYYNLYYYGGGYDLAAAALAKLLPFDPFETRRLAGALVGIAGLAIVWRMTRRLGGPVAGFGALVLLAITPAYYGHMYINAKDLPFAVAMTFLLYTLVRAFDEHPRPQPLTIVLFGLAVGLTLGTRLVGGIAVLFMAIAGAVLFFSEASRLGTRDAAVRSVKLFAWLALALPLSYAVMAFVWPWSVQSPLNPLRALEFYSHFWEKPWKELFDGLPIPILDMPRFYVAKLCLLKLPEVLVAFTVAGTAGGLVAAANGKIEPRRRAMLALLVSAAILPIIITVLTRPVMYNGIRHFLFVLPPLAVLAGLAVSYLYERLADVSRPAAVAGMAAFAAAVAFTVVDLVRIHPYQYTLFNHYAGGVAGARGHYMLDYWGLAFKEASEDLLEQFEKNNVAPPEGRKWRVAVCGPAHTVSFELGPNFETAYEADGADFAFSLGTFYCARLDAPVLAVAQREGVVFARVYDLRGRTYASTYIPPGIDDLMLYQEKIHTFWHDDKEESPSQD